MQDRTRSHCYSVADMHGSLNYNLSMRGCTRASDKREQNRDSQDFFSENKVDGVSTPGIMEGEVICLFPSKA